MTSDAETPAPKQQHGPGVLVDLGPLILFILAYWWKGVFLATGVFMAATAAALIWSKVKYGKISPLLMFSGVTVLIFGGLTIWLHDPRFIKIKPTVYYVAVAAILFFGIITKRPTLKTVMETAYPDLSDKCWHILTRNFAFFFLVMALANEIVWRTTAPNPDSNMSFWLGYKLWGAFPATLLFGLVHVPMIIRESPSLRDDSTEQG
jgi:intracellular septation protein